MSGTPYTAAIYYGLPGFREMATHAARAVGIRARPAEEVRRGGNVLWVVPCSPLPAVIQSLPREFRRRAGAGDVILAVCDLAGAPVSEAELRALADETLRLACYQDDPAVSGAALLRALREAFAPFASARVPERDSPEFPWPAEGGPFLQREREVAEISRRLLDGRTARRVALIGPAGTGISRLAREVATTLRAHFPGGLVYARGPDAEQTLEERAVPDSADRVLVVVDDSQVPLPAALTGAWVLRAGRPGPGEEEVAVGRLGAAGAERLLEHHAGPMPSAAPFAIVLGAHPWAMVSLGHLLSARPELKQRTPDEVIREWAAWTDGDPTGFGARLRALESELTPLAPLSRLAVDTECAALASDLAGVPASELSRRGLLERRGDGLVLPPAFHAWLRHRADSKGAHDQAERAAELLLGWLPADRGEMWKTRDPSSPGYLSPAREAHLAALCAQPGPVGPVRARVQARNGAWVLRYGGETRAEPLLRDALPLLDRVAPDEAVWTRLDLATLLGTADRVETARGLLAPLFDAALAPRMLAMAALTDAEAALTADLDARTFGPLLERAREAASRAASPALVARGERLGLETGRDASSRRESATMLQAAVVVLRRWNESHPDDLSAHVEEARCSMRLASVWPLQSLARVDEILARIRAIDPGNRTDALVVELAVTKAHLGAPDPSSLEHALQVCRAHLSGDRASVRWLRYLSSVLQPLALHRWRETDAPGASALLREDVSVCGEVTGLTDDSRRARRDLATSWMTLGNLLAAIGVPNEAVLAYERALPIREALHAEGALDAEVVQATRRLARR